jgi:hypothetical protein
VEKAYLCRSLWHKTVVEFEHCELGGIEDLIAELAVSLHSQNFQVDIPA